MAVLVEGISVIVRSSAIANTLEGGWERFRLLVANQTCCNDDELVRVGFIYPQEVRACINALEEFGLTFMDQNTPVDMVVCDQHYGPRAICDWIEFTHLTIDGGKVGVAWLWEGKRHGHGTHMRPGMKVATPQGWHFKGSLSDKVQFAPDALVSSRTDH
jgi:hypothetical protein